MTYIPHPGTTVDALHAIELAKDETSKVAVRLRSDLTTALALMGTTNDVRTVQDLTGHLMRKLGPVSGVRYGRARRTALKRIERFGTHPLHRNPKGT